MLSAIWHQALTGCEINISTHQLSLSVGTASGEDSGMKEWTTHESIRGVKITEKKMNKIKPTNRWC
jgi:hypothetical protein